MAAVIGITIAVSDKELSSLGGKLKETADGVEKTGKSTKKGGDEMAKFAKSVLATFAVLKVLEKGAKELGQMFERTLAHRFPDDGLVKSVKGITEAFDRVNNAVFDQFAPLLAGISKVIGPLSEQFAAFVKHNEKLVRTNVVEWAVKVGGTLASALVQGAGLAIKAFLYLGAGIDTVKIIVNKALGAIIDGISTFAFTLGSAAKKLGLDQTARDMAALGLEAGKLGVEFETSANKSVAELRKTSAQIDEVGKTTDKIGGIVKNAIGQIAVQAMKNLGIATDSTAKSMEDYKASIEADLKVMDKVMAKRFALNRQHAQELEKIADLTEADAQRSAEAWNDSFQRQMGHEGLGGLLEAWRMHLQSVEDMNRMSVELTGKPMKELTTEQKKNLQTLTDATKSAADSIASSISFITDPWKDFIKGTIDASTAFDRMIDSIESKILDFVTSKIVEALLNVVIGIFTGGIGSLLGGTLTGGLNLKSSIMASPTSNINFARGGVPSASGGLKITGGAPGRDSVLVRTMRDERILTPAENREWERGRRGGGSGDTMRVEYHGFPQSQAEIERWAEKSLVPVVRKIKSRGAWPQ